MYSQYNEEQILLNLFNRKKNGFLIEVGAANGIVNSNTRNLIENFDWTGVLIEPNPLSFVELEKLYSKNINVTTVNKGVANVEGEQDMNLHIFGNNQVDYQISSFDTEFRKRIIKRRGDGYSKIVPVKMSSLRLILSNNSVPSHIDFMSVDCEGFDIQVLESNCWNTFRPTIVCVELSMPVEILNDVMQKSLSTVKTPSPKSYQ